MDFENIEFDLLRELNDFTEAIAFKAKEKGLDFILNTDEVTHPNIIADGGRIRQILTNLVGNAVKFTHEGNITITASLEATDESTGRLRLDVSDTGIGIAQSKLQSLFDPFTQADGSTTRKYGGTGLGLSIVKSLCALMNGSISVQSTLGKGSVFSIDIQVGLGKGETLADIQQSNMIDQETDVQWPELTRILLVEDNHTNQIVAQGMLESMGLYADIADNGIEAIESLKLSTLIAPYTVILMDCQMPEMDGYEASTAIRQGEAGEAHTKVPIIAMTANAMSGDREKCVAAGMDDYISKPINLTVLKNTLIKWLIGDGITIDKNIQNTMPEQTLSTELPLWDEAEALERLGGKEKLLKIVVDSFLKEAPVVVQNLSRSLKAGDFKQAQLHAHSIKGSCGNIGAKKLQEIAKQIEHAAQEDDMETIRGLYPEFKEVYTLTINTLQKESH